MSGSALFHPRLLRQTLASAAFPSDLHERHARLQPWINQLESGELQRTNESQLQGELILKVFGGILGYTTRMGGDGRQWTVEREENVARSGRQAADGAIGWFRDGQPAVVHAVIELKGAAQPLDHAGGRGRTPVQQAWDYANETRTCRWIIVSNYAETRLYHRSRSKQDVEVFALAELRDLDAFKRFWLLLCRESLLPATPFDRAPLDELLDGSDRAQLEVTAKLYEDYKGVREELFEHLRRRHSNLPPLEVLHATQKLLDRVLFIAFAEDRKLLPEETIVRIVTDGWFERSFWDSLKQVFRWVDEGNAKRGFSPFNGGLFAPDPALDELLPENDALRSLERIARYDFSEDVSVEVLGHIFEQSITDLEELRAGLDGKAVPGISKRKRQGVFYTPSFVTRYVVAETLGRTLAERFEAALAAHRPEEVRGANKQREAWERVWTEYRESLRTIRVLDPACGSGAFLIAAYDLLHAEYERTNQELAALRGGQIDLFDLTAAILNGNLFGVDVNRESVEITKLSLWLKTAQRNSKLTSLDGNIRWGNSIVSDPAFAPDAFDWSRGRAVWDVDEPEPGEIAPDPAQWSAGFDVVLGNPPYVRQELLTDIKPHLLSSYRAFHGMADLFVYFFERGLDRLRPGGRLGFIVANKWMKSGYGERLRTLLATTTNIELLIDFGHAPIFPDADAFPSIIAVQRPAEGSSPTEDRALWATVFPRESLDGRTVDDFVRERRVGIPQRELDPAGWSLEPPGVRRLMAHMREVGVRLEEVCGAPLYGIKTGYNEAYLIDTATRDRLLAEDPGASEVIRPFLRGRDVGRWVPAWGGEYMIALASSGDRRWPWTGLPEEEAERRLCEAMPSIHAHVKSHEARLRQRADQGQYWWELRSCAYYAALAAPKIVYQEIQFHPQYALDDDGYLGNNKMFLLPTTDPWLLAVLNSAAMWWHNWRYLPHMKDEALSPSGVKMVDLPIPEPDAATRADVSSLVAEIVEARRASDRVTSDLLSWLRSEHGVESPGRMLSDFSALSADAFVAEVKKRRPKATPRLTPRDLRALRDEHEAQRLPFLRRIRDILRIERRLSDHVNRAYRLTAEDVDLVRRTAPPRMPPGLTAQAGASASELSEHLGPLARPPLP